VPNTLPSPNAAIDPARTRSDSPPLGKTARLLDEARALIDEADQDAKRRHAELSARTSGLEEMLREMEKLLIRTERQAAQLANLYVATYQLHASLEAADVRAAIADIAVNLLGAETFSIWMRDDTGALVRAPESGTHLGGGQPTEPYTGGDALLESCVADRALKLAPVEATGSVAAVPFVAQGELLGVLVVHRILSQKAGFTPEDRELLELLAAHAASALLAARAFHVTQRKLQAYEGLLGFLRRPGQ
jgi:GAF domain-containing protein